MANRIKFFGVAILIFILPLHIFAQEEEHSHNTKEEHSDATTSLLPEETPVTSDSVFMSFQDFPNLHPLVVHFPIVLLILALFTQLLGLITYRKQLSWITFLLLIGGFAGALLASQVFHAHVGGASEHVHELFESHEYYGKTTVWLAGIALLLKSISHFMLKRKTWLEILVFIVVTGSAITVSLAGHLGSQMVHIENVGPQGNFLEQHEHEE